MLLPTMFIFFLADVIANIVADVIATACNVCVADVITTEADVIAYYVFIFMADVIANIVADVIATECNVLADGIAKWQMEWPL